MVDFPSQRDKISYIFTALPVVNERYKTRTVSRAQISTAKSNAIFHRTWRPRQKIVHRLDWRNRWTSVSWAGCLDSDIFSLAKHYFFDSYWRWTPSLLNILSDHHDWAHIILGITAIWTNKLDEHWGTNNIRQLARRSTSQAHSWSDPWVISLRKPKFNRGRAFIPQFDGVSADTVIG